MNPLCQVITKNNYFKLDLKQHQDFEQIKQETDHAVAFGPVHAGSAVRKMLYTAAREHSLWKKISEAAWGLHVGFWKQWLLRIWDTLHHHPKKKTKKETDTSNIWVGSSCFISCWYRSIAPLGTFTACATLDVQREYHVSDAIWSTWIALITEVSIREP